jgi:rhodanese-related sulfurtransferase
MKKKNFMNMKKKAFNKIDSMILVGLIILLIIGVITVIYIIYKNSSIPEKDILIGDINNSAPDSGSVVIPTPSFIFKEVSIAEALSLVNKNKNNSKFMIIDVSSDYDNGHIANAVSYPIDTFETAITSLDKTGIYLVYSRNDDSRTAAKIMADNTFENVYRLQGNYGAWVVAGFPVAH